MEKTAVIKKCIMIDNRRLEVYWSDQVTGADNENNFTIMIDNREAELVHWTQDQDWNYGTVYQKESMRTTLTLKEPVDQEQCQKMTVQVLGNIKDLRNHQMDTNGTYQVVYEPYYCQFRLTRDGILVKAGAAVKSEALDQAVHIIDLMLSKIPQVGTVLKEQHADVAIYGLLENAYDIPEHRMGYWLATRHVEGFGGEKSNPMSSISEANLIRLRSGRYATMYPHEMILVHEFGHAVHLVGINGMEDTGLADQITECYESAEKSGKWHDTYAISNYEEYFATLGTIWFNVMQEGVDGKWDGIRGPVNTREELKEYDPKGYALMEKIYPEENLPAPWHINTDFYQINGEPRKEIGRYDLPDDKFEWKFIG